MHLTKPITMETLENNMLPQRTLPNSTVVLILGIASIPFCCCYFGLIGLALGIVAIFLYGKANTLYQQDPGAFTEKSYKNLKAGRICAIIGVILSCLMVLYAVWLFQTFGWDAMQDPELLQQKMQEMFQ
jgi:M penetrans paralogue family 26